LVESTLAEERDSAVELLSAIGTPAASTFRVGVTGVPGAGKSTLIDVLGCQAVAAGARVAVLAIDPSSHKSGGSVLGDKTRMTRLSAEPHAFIRPSPTLGVLGGTASRTREVISLCEAAGYDVIFVETVGVGQSEERVANMVDCVLLLLLAGAGDEVSSMKRGVLEAADLIAFNKADGERALAVEADAASLRASLGISRGQRQPNVLVLSALQESGVSELWAALAAYRSQAGRDGTLGCRRSEQRRAWFEAALEEGLRELFAHQPTLALAREEAETSVINGLANPLEAARRLIARLLPGARE
ncbi:MAG TPA: methylmalonyl Co-A mutase-associated GTPase MeaB, partial [Polyangiaceae bacterium]|nr:methylmalonyl Co-A mutase-associated GTPase MeaB [Polyangiaceae bacterium]